MNWLVKWGVKKWLVGVANKALDMYNRNVTRARAIVANAITKTEAVVGFLKSLDAKLDDGKLTEEEADAIIDEAVEVAQSLTA